MENQIVKNVYSVLTEIQNELKAPKNQWNAFGKYKYRSCEDIQEALKPLLKKYSCTLFLTDTIISVENRFYIGAKAVFIYNTTGENNNFLGRDAGVCNTNWRKNRNFWIRKRRRK